MSNNSITENTGFQNPQSQSTPSFFQKNNKYLPFLALLLFLILGITKMYSNTSQTESKDSSSGTFTDARDGKIYKWVKLKDGKKWMAENLNYNTSDSYCYNNDNKNCEEYGRLYTWKSVKSACSSGWHLPSNREWENLRKLYGGHKSSQRFLIKGGRSGFEALLGGDRFRSNAFTNLGLSGYFWSTTETVDAWIGYGFGKEFGEMFTFYDYDKDKTTARSCRCVKD